MELNVLVYTNSGHSAPSDLTVTVKYHAGLLKPFSLAVVLLMKNTHTTFYLLTGAEMDPK